MIPLQLIRDFELTPTPIIRWADSVLSRIIVDAQGIAPNLLYALVFLVAGIIVAKLVSKFVARTSRRLGVDSAAEDSLIGDAINGQNVGDLLGKFAALYVYLLTGLLVARELGLGQVAGSFNGAVGFLPTVVIALGILALGFWLADLVEDRMTDSELGDGQVGMLFGAAVQVFIYVIAIAVGFGALASSLGAGGIAFPIVQAFALGFAIALGLAVGWVSKEHLGERVPAAPSDDD